MNPLRAPDSVNQSIEVIMEVSADGDFEVAAPTGKFFSYTAVDNLNPVWSPIVAPLSFDIVDYSIAPVEAQGGEPDSSVELALDRDFVAPPSEALGNIARNNALNVDFAQISVGERVNSFRQLLKRFEPTSAPTDITDFVPTVTTSDNTFSYSILPYNFTFASRTNVDSPSAVITNSVTPTLLSYVAGCYRFMRGSMRLKVNPSDDLPGVYFTRLNSYATSNTTNPMVTSYQTNALTTGVVGDQNLTYDNSSLTGYSNQIYNKNNINGVIELEVPFYNNLPFIPTFFSSFFQQSVLVYNSLTNTKNFSQVQSNVVVHRAVGDDFEFGFYTGFPPIQFVDFTKATTAVVAPMLQLGDFGTGDLQVITATVLNDQSEIGGTFSPNVYPAVPFIESLNSI